MTGPCGLCSPRCPAWCRNQRFKCLAVDEAGLPLHMVKEGRVASRKTLANTVGGECIELALLLQNCTT